VGLSRIARWPAFGLSCGTCFSLSGERSSPFASFDTGRESLWLRCGRAVARLGKLKLTPRGTCFSLSGERSSSVASFDTARESLWFRDGRAIARLGKLKLTPRGTCFSLPDRKLEGLWG
jgi:hypothetical protein